MRCLRIADGIDLSARDGAGRALGKPDQEPDVLKAAAEKQEWDASVKSLVAAPSYLQMMSDRLDRTQKLGEAFHAQEQDMILWTPCSGCARGLTIERSS
jgi:hypothetical protein